MSANGAGLVLEAPGTGLVIFCVYDTVVLDSSEYIIVGLESSLVCIVPGRGFLLVNNSVHERVFVFVSDESKMSPCV